MITLTQLCARVGIDEAAARAVLDARRTHDDSPWYVQAMLGIGAWVTVIMTLLFVVAFMGVMDIDEPDLPIALAGAILFAAALALLHRKADGVFTTHLAIAIGVAGTLMAAAGVGFVAESVWSSLIATLPFAALAIWQRRSLLLQFLVVGITATLALVSVWEETDQVVEGLAAIAVPFAVYFLLFPPRWDVRPAAFALLLVPGTVELIAQESGAWMQLYYGWPARMILLGTFVLVSYVNWPRLPARQRLIGLAGVAIAAAVALLMPPGASLALVLLALAYTLGSRPLAILGALAEIYFIWMFYRDLQESLLIKSVILMAVGALLLGCYALAVMAGRERRTQ